MTDYVNFSEKAIMAAIATAQEHNDDYTARTQGQASTLSFDDGHMQILAECVELTLKNRKACLKLPLNIGKICIPVPIDYDGKAARACLKICTTWGIPSGVVVTVSVGGIVIVKKSFGKC